jgi:hypothetical protein
VSFVSPTGREMASEFMTTVTSVDYINSTTLTQVGQVPFDMHDMYIQRHTFTYAYVYIKHVF